MAGWCSCASASLSPTRRERRRSRPFTRRAAASRRRPSRATKCSAGRTPTRAGRQQGCAGWEYILAMDLPGNAERIASEAVALLSAPACPPDQVRTVILGGAQVALQVHEIVRASHRTGSRVRRGGRLRRHFLPHHRQTQQLQVRLAGGEPHRRQRARHAVWAPSAGTTRACRPARRPSCATGGSSAT